MRRRDLILFGLGAVIWPLAVAAQQSGKLPTVGFLVAGTPSSHGRWVNAFVDRLRELGWIDGRTFAIECRWAEGQTERGAAFAAELVQQKVDVIVADGTAIARAAKQATSVIPIIFSASGDPVGTGLIASLAHPGGNVTGLSIQQADAAAKRFQFLRETIPGLRQVAVLCNIDTPILASEMHQVQTAASTLGLEVSTLGVSRGEDIAPAIETLNGHAEALYILNDPLVDAHRVEISALALAARIPTTSNSREFVEAGSLMSYGTDFSDLFRRAADLVDKVLKGAKPADLPVEQPTKFELVINLKTAKALAIDMPPLILAAADHVIE